MKLKSKNFLGGIIAIGAIGIMILKYQTNGDLDSYIMPFILLCLAVIIFTTKPKKEEKQIQLNRKQRTVLLSILSVTLVSGIVTFFIHMF